MGGALFLNESDARHYAADALKKGWYTTCVDPVVVNRGALIPREAPFFSDAEYQVVNPELLDEYREALKKQKKPTRM